jgi:hypothetical protein
MAAVAGQLQMFSLEGEICHRMVKILDVQVDGIECASLVLGMAAKAWLCRVQPAVVAYPGGAVAGNIRVAVQAQDGLFPLERLVAAVALFLKIGMGSKPLQRHPRDRLFTHRSRVKPKAATYPESKRQGYKNDCGNNQGNRGKERRTAFHRQTPTLNR